MKRIVVVGLLAGIAMFVWSSIAHMLLPLGGLGVKQLPDDQAVLGPMFTALGQTRGLYFFPAMDTRGDQRNAMAQYEKKLAVSPSGILLYHPPGANAMTAGQLATEFLTELVEAFAAVLLLAWSHIRGFQAQAGFVALIGVLAAITTNVPYWNWYGFPADYTAGYMTTQIIGFAVAGLVAASILAKKERRNREATAG